MPLPLMLGAAAIIAGATGVGTAIHGGIKMKKASDTMKQAKRLQEDSIKAFKKVNSETTKAMDSLGVAELKILKSFETFSDIIEKIQNRPKFKDINKDENIPEYNPEDLKNASVGAGALLGAIGGAAAGTAGGFAAAGATTSAVIALGTASTGTAISTLSGAAATNAVLATLGGGTLASGGGGMALGATILGGATLGVGLLVGGVIFSITGSKLSSKANEALKQAQRTNNEVIKIIPYLNLLKVTANSYHQTLDNVNMQYIQHLSVLHNAVNINGKTEWNDFTDKEKKATENTILLVGLLYEMCKLQLVIQNKDKNGINGVNVDGVQNMREKKDAVFKKIKAA